MSMDFILVWQAGTCNVLCGNTFLHSPEKPGLSFSFDELVCESPTNVYFKVVGNTQIILTEDEIIECHEYCDKFIENGDYVVFAYDPNDSNLFIGELTKQECEAKGYRWVIDSTPETPVCSYDESTNKWVNFVAALTEDGILIVNPSQNSKKFVQFLTEAQLNNFPKPERDSDVWDFATENWMDKRDINRVRKEAMIDLRNNFDAMRWRESGGFVTAYEQGTWQYQLNEAKAYLADNTAETPYIDAFISARDDTDIPTKQALCEDIIANHNSYLIAQAKTSARIWHYLKLIESANTCYEIDDIRTNYTKEIDTYLKETA